MRFHVVLRYIGMVLLFNAAFMLISALISYTNGIDSGYTPLMFSTLVTLTFNHSLFYLINKIYVNHPLMLNEFYYLFYNIFLYKLLNSIFELSSLKKLMQGP